MTRPPREQRIVAEPEHGRDVVDTGPTEPLAEHLQDRGLRIDRVDAPGRTDRAREPQREITWARPDLRDDLPAPKTERANDPARLLPRGARRGKLALDHVGEIGRVPVAPVTAMIARHRLHHTHNRNRPARSTNPRSHRDADPSTRFAQFGRRVARRGG